MANRIGERVYGSHGGERKWILNRIKENSGKILDFGCGNRALLACDLAKRGFEVIAIDILPCSIEDVPQNLHYIQADIMSIEFETRHFDHIINCSSLEHAGLEGRYGSKNELDQDLRIMKLFERILKQDGLQFLTMPIGIGAVLSPWHRVYGEKRLSRVLEGWQIIEKEFWTFGFQEGKRWYRVTEEEALREAPRLESPFLTAKGLYVLGLK